MSSYKIRARHSFRTGISRIQMDHRARRMVTRQRRRDLSRQKASKYTYQYQSHTPLPEGFLFRSSRPVTGTDVRRPEAGILLRTQSSTSTLLREFQDMVSSFSSHNPCRAPSSQVRRREAREAQSYSTRSLISLDCR